MMLRPRWIGALVFALLLAGGFAWLGQWQLERAVAAGTVVDVPSETVLPLAQVAKPGGPIKDTATGQYVSVAGSTRASRWSPTRPSSPGSSATC